MRLIVCLQEAVLRSHVVFGCGRVSRAFVGRLVCPGKSFSRRFYALSAPLAYVSLCACEVFGLSGRLSVHFITGGAMVDYYITVAYNVPD